MEELLGAEKMDSKSWWCMKKQKKEYLHTTTFMDNMRKRRPAQLYFLRPERNSAH